MKKKILIVDCNAKIGGIQKALIALLKQIHDVYDVTLLLLNREGTLLQDIPQDVRVLETQSDFRYMGMAQCDCKCARDRIRRGFYALISRLWGRKFAVEIASRRLRCEHGEEYEVAIAYSHMSGERSFFGGCAEYVLRAAKARKKLCYIHCDYLNSGNRSAYSDAIYAQFDAILCVSQSTKARFLAALEALSERTYAVQNPIDEALVIREAHQDAVEYNREHLNLVSVARLTQEKGILRMLPILSRMDTSRIRYYIVGDGAQRVEIEKKIEALKLNETVVLCGESFNPYRHMLNADLLVVPSYHEAAPVVFQEARALGLPILTTRTTSAEEMVGEAYGFVVENTDDALEAGLRDLIAHPEKIRQKKEAMAKRAPKMTGPLWTLADTIEKLTKSR